MIDLNKLTAGKHLTTLEEDILAYIVKNISDIQDMGVRAVAKETFTSPASVIRLSKKMGYSGFTDMYYSLLPLIKKAENDPFSTEGTLLNYDFSTMLSDLSEEKLDLFIEHILLKKETYTFIYATGFSKIIAEYIYKKLLVLGRKAILSSGSDSLGIFENNLEDIGAMLVISKSGETDQVYSKLKKASEADIFTVSFTQNSDNRIANLSDLTIPIYDTNKLDDRNMLPNVFFPCVLLSFEYIVEHYLNHLIQE